MVNRSRRTSSLDTFSSTPDLARDFIILSPLIPSVTGSMPTKLPV